MDITKAVLGDKFVNNVSKSRNDVGLHLETEKGKQIKFTESRQKIIKTKYQIKRWRKNWSKKWSLWKY